MSELITEYFSIEKGNGYQASTNINKNDLILVEHIDVIINKKIKV